MNFSQHTANFLLICLVYRQTLQHFARVSERFLCSGLGTILKVFFCAGMNVAQDRGRDNECSAMVSGPDIWGVEVWPQALSEERTGSVCLVSKTISSENVEGELS